jgi:hypothetical protein
LEEDEDLTIGVNTLGKSDAAKKHVAKVQQVQAMQKKHKGSGRR